MEQLLSNPTPDCLPLIFLHMYKAGGTSFRQYIRAQYPIATVKHIEGYIPDLVEWQRESEEERHRIDLLMGHQYYGNHEYLRPHATYITMLREPIDRVLSFYHFVEREPDHYLYDYGFVKGMSVIEMIEGTQCIEIDNVQVRMLNPQPEEPPAFGTVSEEMLETACHNLRAISKRGFVGVVERMGECLRLLQHRYGWNPAHITRANVTAKRPPVDAHDEASLAALREYNRYDMRLYAFAEELLSSEMAEVGERV